MSANESAWSKGLEACGECPQCGVPVFLRWPSDEKQPPTPVYLCACRLRTWPAVNMPLAAAGCAPTGLTTYYNWPVGAVPGLTPGVVLPTPCAHCYCKADGTGKEWCCKCNQMRPPTPAVTAATATVPPPTSLSGLGGSNQLLMQLPPNRVEL